MTKKQRNQVRQKNKVSGWFEEYWKTWTQKAASRESREKENLVGIGAGFVGLSLALYTSKASVRRCSLYPSAPQYRSNSATVKSFATPKVEPEKVVSDGFSACSKFEMALNWAQSRPQAGSRGTKLPHACERKSLPHQKVTLHQMLPRIRPGWQCWRGDSFREHSQTHQGLSLLDLRWLFCYFFQVAKSSSLHFDFDPSANRTASWFVHANRTLFRPAHCPTLV